MNQSSVQWRNNNVEHSAITQQVVCGAVPHEIIHTLCTTDAMCIDSVWHCSIMYSTLCVYASGTVARLHNSNWFITSPTLCWGHVKGPYMDLLGCPYLCPYPGILSSKNAGVQYITHQGRPWYSHRWLHCSLGSQECCNTTHSPYTWQSLVFTQVIALFSL